MSLVKLRPLATAAVSAAVIALAGGAALAQDSSGQNDRPRESRFVRFLDTNGDGKVSLDEINAEQKRLIAASDVNGDGKLSVDEFRRRGRLFMRLHATTLFDLMDANGDKELTEDEIAKPSARWFARYDENGDGALVSDEVPQRRWGRHGRRAHRGGARR